MVANGQSEATFAAVKLHFEVDFTVREKTFSHDQPRRPFGWSSVSATQQYNTRYASGKSELSLLFNAIEK